MRWRLFTAEKVAVRFFLKKAIKVSNSVNPKDSYDWNVPKRKTNLGLATQRARSRSLEGRIQISKWPAHSLNPRIKFPFSKGRNDLTVGLNTSRRLIPSKQVKLLRGLKSMFHRIYAKKNTCGCHNHFEGSWPQEFDISVQFTFTSLISGCWRV